MRRAAALLALGLGTLSAAPASAGCVEDWAAPRPGLLYMPSDPVEVSTGGGTVSVGSPWAYGTAMSEVDRAKAFVDCVV